MNMVKSCWHRISLTHSFCMLISIFSNSNHGKRTVWSCHSKILLYLTKWKHEMMDVVCVKWRHLTAVSQHPHKKNMHCCVLAVKYYCNMVHMLPSRGNWSWMTCISGKVTPSELCDSRDSIDPSIFFTCFDFPGQSPAGATSSHYARNGIHCG